MLCHYTTTKIVIFTLKINFLQFFFQLLIQMAGSIIYFPLIFSAFFVTLHFNNIENLSKFHRTQNRFKLCQI